MNTNVCKTILFFTFVFLTVFLSSQKVYVVADTSNTTNQEAYNSLNFETRNFVGRLNQLPQDFTFNKNLKRGTTVTPDVQNLKWILNSDTRTALTDNPNMTLNELTSAFGPITESAVKRFQTVYRSEILDPQGIKNATGVVGTGTRQKLNSLLAKSRVLSGNVNNTSANNTNNYNTYYNSTYYNSNKSANYNYVDFSNIENFINLRSFSQAHATTSSSSISISTTTSTSSTSTNSGTILYTPTQATTANTLTTTNNLNSIGNNDSSPEGLETLAILGGAALLGVAANATGKTVASNASQIALGQFGGRIIMNTPCPCSANYMITLFDLSLKAPISVVFQPGVSSLKMNYNPTVGENVLGGYVRGTGVCLIYVGTGCSPSPTGVPLGTIDTVRGVGTTLTPVSK